MWCLSRQRKRPLPGWGSVQVDDSVSQARWPLAHRHQPFSATTGTRCNVPLHASGATVGARLAAIPQSALFCQGQRIRNFIANQFCPCNARYCAHHVDNVAASFPGLPQTTKSFQHTRDRLQAFQVRLVSAFVFCRDTIHYPIEYRGAVCETALSPVDSSLVEGRIFWEHL